MSDHSVAHGTFVVERTYNHPVEKVWAAWSDSKLKARWFGGGPEAMPAQTFEFKSGGRESRQGIIDPNGPNFRFDVLYQDIVPNSRIVYNYDMHMDGKKISVSLAAVEFWPEGGQTKLRLTEYGLFLDGLDNAAQRKEGTMALIRQLGEFLDGKR
jgi:uncharacterized protein YndB with AHSA1/START domain